MADYMPEPCRVCGGKAEVLYTGPLRYRHKHAEDCWVPRDPVGFEEPRKGCWCIRCDGDHRLDGMELPRYMRIMVLCPTCGNKRCPKATNHVMPCTGSNDAEQPGSDYCSPTRPDGTPIVPK